ncbi:MAG: hypothetical protein HOO06_16325 [Bdellovibrionaceae bacterium]|jgi:hypothetical protein|nr:hypothetical protein [Pseudobdellovibrionaceae bacterium]
MLPKIILTLLFSISAYSADYQTCTADNIGQVAIAGFCISSETPTPISQAEQSELSKILVSFEIRFPKLFSIVHKNGYFRLIIKPTQIGENGGAVLAKTLTEQKIIVLYKDFFIANKKIPALKNFKFSVSEVALLHELIHAFDEDNNLVVTNLEPLGWNLTEHVPIDGYRIHSLPQIANTWIKATTINTILADLSPLLPTLGPWEIYTLARDRVKTLGYPTVYSIVGGPLESFAELGAYIALDPEASNYIPLKTIHWFQKNILR